MSAGSFGRENGGQYGWQGGWNFASLDDDLDDTFDGLHDVNDTNANLPSYSLSTTHRDSPPSRPRDGGSSRANDTSFFNNLLHVTAPERRRPQPQPQPSADSHIQDTLTRRHPADQPRDTYRSTLSQTNNRHNFPDYRPPQSHFGHVSNLLFDEDDNSTPPSTQPSARVSDRASEEFVTLEDDTDEEGLEIMAPTRRRTNNVRSNMVDLTSGASSAETTQQRPRGRKRSADSDGGQASKRGRISQEDIEEIDLSKDAPSAEEELLQQQQRDAIKQQQAAEEDNGPYKIGQRTCIICMENFTNCTIASCGHFYCHECLIQALLAGEKNSDRGSGTCPQCRKPLSRNNKKKRDIIPLSFMKKETFAKNQQKRLQAS